MPCCILRDMSKEQTPSPKIILAVGAHADDMEFCIGGSVASWVQQGDEVYYLVLTDGAKGTADPSVTPEELRAKRRDEQRAAARISGVKEVFFCDYEDGALQVSSEVVRDIVKIIRQVRPDIVVTMDPTMIYSVEHRTINHPDHRAAGQATLDAVFPMARDHLSFPELGLKPHKTATVLLVHYDKATDYVDITDTIGTKLEALRAHLSQFGDAARIEQAVREFASRAGEKAGVTYAEGFVRIDIRDDL